VGEMKSLNAYCCRNQPKNGGLGSRGPLVGGHPWVGVGDHLSRHDLKYKKVEKGSKQQRKSIVVLLVPLFRTCKEDVQGKKKTRKKPGDPRGLMPEGATDLELPNLGGAARRGSTHGRKVWR